MNIMAAIIISTVLMSGCGLDLPSTPLYYLSTGIPVFAVDKFPHYEDVQGALDANIEIMSRHYGQDVRPQYLTLTQMNGTHILFTPNREDMVLENSAGEFDGIQIRILYFGGCTAFTGLAHELTHMAQFAMEPGKMDHKHNTPGFWVEDGNYVTEAQEAALRFCSEEFYSEYAKFEQSPAAELGDP